MFDDPYAVLGLTPDASDDDVKKAYRALARKYHPDMNPGDEYAAQKMNEINAAYDQIKNPPKQSSWRGQDPFDGWYRQQDRSGTTAEFPGARQYISAGRYQDALNQLNAVPPAGRTAAWYCLSAIANTNLGNRVLGHDQIVQACRMEPNNEEFRLIREQIEFHGQVYRQAQKDFHFNGFDVSKLCLTLCICFNLNTCCGYRYFFCC